MISAGQYAPQTPTHGYHQQPTGYPPQGQGYGQGQQPEPFQFQPMSLPNQQVGPTGPNMNITWTPKNDKFMNKYLVGQTVMQAGGMVAGIINTSLNYALAKQAMTAQVTIAGKYYEVQGKIAGYQKDVAIEQLGVQGEAIDAQRDMHMNQCSHEERMAKLAGNTEARKAAIEDRGRTDRAKIFATTDAFSRRGWDMGSPFAA